MKKGIPTFIDKPFAYDTNDARKIIKIAKQYSTPIMSLSMLKETPQVRNFQNRLKEIGAPEFGTIKGIGTNMAGHIHTISFAQGVFGSGVESVECMGQSSLGYVHLSYGDKKNRPKDGIILNCASGGSPHCAMYVSAYSKIGAIHSPPIGDFVYPYGAANILKKIKKMVKTNEPQEPYEDMLECIAIADAARVAQKERRCVKLRKVTR